MRRAAATAGVAGSEAALQAASASAGSRTQALCIISSNWPSNDGSRSSRRGPTSQARRDRRFPGAQPGAGDLFTACSGATAVTRLNGGSRPGVYGCMLHAPPARIALCILFGWFAAAAVRAQVEPPVAVAVLPFVNISGVSDDDWIGAGMAENRDRGAVRAPAPDSDRAWSGCGGDAHAGFFRRVPGLRHGLRRGGPGRRRAPCGGRRLPARRRPNACYGAAGRRAERGRPLPRRWWTGRSTSCSRFKIAWRPNCLPLRTRTTGRVLRSLRREGASQPGRRSLGKDRSRPARRSGADPPNRPAREPRARSRKHRGPRRKR